MERSHAAKLQSRVETEWDRTLALLRAMDFDALGPGEEVEELRGLVEIWHDITQESPRRIASHGALLGLPSDPAEALEYMHRVLVGTDPGSYLALCDQAEEGLKAISRMDGPTPGPQLRDMLVELMELGVHTTIQTIEWLDRRLRDLERGP
jgi:hypothetical protein